MEDYLIFLTRFLALAKGILFFTIKTKLVLAQAASYFFLITLDMRNVQFLFTIRAMS